MRARLRYGIIIMGCSAVFCLSGCTQGKKFFTQVENFIDGEGRGSDEFATSIKVYASREIDKTDALKTQYSGFVKGEKVQGETLASSTTRYAENERRLMPKPFRAIRSAQHGVNFKNRTFPRDDE